MSRIVITGAGIIGLSIAYELSKSGHEIEILEREPTGGGCSRGNAGMIVPSHFSTLPSPGIIGQALRWLGSRSSPFSIRLSTRKDLLGFLWKFYRHTGPGHEAKYRRLLADFHLYSRDLYLEWKKELPDFRMETRGISMLYNSEKGKREEQELAERSEALGMPVQILGPEELSAMEPGLKMNALGAAHYPLDAHLDPEHLMRILEAELQAKNISLNYGIEVRGADFVNSDLKVLRTSGGSVSADIFVFAAGTWSSELMKSLNIRMPMASGKGYSFLAENPNATFRIPKLINEARVTVTPLGDHVRFGGTMMLGDRSDRIHSNRLRGILSSVSTYFPETLLPDKNAMGTWYGLRPLSPDGLPYIGQLDRLPNVFVATGHSMLGVSLAPATGRILSNLIDNKPPGISLESMHPERFSP